MMHHSVSGHVSAHSDTSSALSYPPVSCRTQHLCGRRLELTSELRLRARCLLHSQADAKALQRATDVRRSPVLTNYFELSRACKRVQNTISASGIDFVVASLR